MLSSTRDLAQTPSPPGAARLAVVGIGASAGGLSALQQLVHAIPADSGMAFVVIMHLDPARESRIAELLQDRADIPVEQVSGPTEVEADHVYVIPPDGDIAMRGSVITVRPRGERATHAPVDLFFGTLAEAYGKDAVGVVLSGTGADGTLGVRAIRAHGGITVAQSPEEALYDGMPASAIATGLIDLVLPAARIPAELLALRGQSSDLDEKVVRPDVEEALAQVFAVLRGETGHDFSGYKRSTVLRRLERRLLFNGIESLEAYVPLLKSSRTECQALVQDLLISVSAFFRDPKAFEALATLIPSLFEGKGPEDSVRVWVVGCATGEEAYSIAMLLAEHAAELDDPPKIQMFATDIDEKGYAWGREGFYPAAAVAAIEPGRLARFFLKEGEGYRVSRSLREMVLFAVHDVLQDPPFVRMDLISCRNLFIYLRPEAQLQVQETFHYSLNPQGLLFLGASETVGDRGLFRSAGGEAPVYRRVATPHRVLPRTSAHDPFPRPGNPAPPPIVTGSAGAGFSYGALHVHMLEEYAPPSVVVDERGDVVHLSLNASTFLRLREGEPTHRLLDLVPRDVRPALRTALHHAMKEGVPTSRRVRMSLGGADRNVDVQVRTTTRDGGSGRFALVLFRALEEGSGLSSPGTSGDAPAGKDLGGLEEELVRTRAELESTIAAHDATVAELQMVNEELRSINEEEKAAAEELETGREEIQSVNEELTTINQEHQSTIEELKRTNADLQNLIQSTEIATVFLDRGARIRRYTPPAATIFHFVPTDIGRPLRDITHGLDFPDLLEVVGQVLESLQRIEREVTSDDGESYIVRINAYRSLDGDVDGAVITLFNNSAQYRIEEALREAKAVAESANLAKGTFLATLSHEFRTPLSAMMGYAELLQLEGALDAEQDKKVERIKAGGRHMVSMIEEILSFARLDGGHEEIASEVVDAGVIAGDVESLTEPAAVAKDLTFTVELPGEPVEVKTDVGKVRQVLINLCGNAVKYTERGGVTLSVRGEPERVVFEVRDTGVGIAPEHHALIFERFWQVDGGATRLVGGMGIGLAAAREYARLLGGDVEVESTRGKGSTFRFWLPAEPGRG